MSVFPSIEQVSLVEGKAEHFGDCVNQEKKTKGHATYYVKQQNQFNFNLFSATLRKISLRRHVGKRKPLRGVTRAPSFKVSPAAGKSL